MVVCECYNNSNENSIKLFKAVRNDGPLGYAVENISFQDFPFENVVTLVENNMAQLLTGDFNGDAKTDLLLINSSADDANWNFYFSMGNNRKT